MARAERSICVTFTSLDAVLFTVGFLVPGFVWSAVLSMLLPRKAVPTEVRFLEFLTFSCLNHGFWAWALFLIFKTGFIDEYPYWAALALYVIIFASPLALGVASGWLQQNGMVARFLARFGFRTIDPAPTAWDWHFSQTKPYWVLVTLKNGEQVYGLFGTRSFAGDDPNHRDLYIEAVFRLLETDEWAPVEDSAGILIAPDEISAIEFRKVAEVPYD
jgi:hypothetical protein